MLLSLLLLPLLGAGLLFATPSAKSKTLAVALALLSLGLSFVMLADFTFENAKYEIDVPFSKLINSHVHFAIDGLALLFVILTNLIVALVVISTSQRDYQNVNQFLALIFLMQFGLLGVFCSMDGLMFYIFWELTLIPIWFICGLWGEEDKRIKTTTKFFVYTFVGSLFMLAGFVFLYGKTGDFSLQALYQVSLTSAEQVMVFWLIFVAFAIKLPIFPFHSWQPDTYTHAPTQGSMLLSGIMLKMAIFAIIRYLIPITPAAFQSASGEIVIALAIFGVVYGALIAMVQKDIKRIMAFSSMSHVGLIVAGMFASLYLSLDQNTNIDGMQGALLQSFAHGINVVGLFLCADVLIKRFGTRDITQMRGLAKVAPKFATLFLIVLLGAMAVPLTNGFVGEFILLKTIYDYSPIMVIFAGLSVIFCAVYMLRLYGQTMFGPLEATHLDAKTADLNDAQFTVLASVAVFVVVFGLFPNAIIELVTPSLNFIFKSMTN
jgi:NADH-quinone oxidoreductase subunit M